MPFSEGSINSIEAMDTEFSISIAVLCASVDGKSTKGESNLRKEKEKRRKSACRDTIFFSLTTLHKNCHCVNKYE